jgi:hypothetical protein
LTLSSIGIPFPTADDVLHNAAWRNYLKDKAFALGSAWPN